MDYNIFEENTHNRTLLVKTLAAAAEAATTVVTETATNASTQLSSLTTSAATLLIATTPFLSSALASSTASPFTSPMIPNATDDLINTDMDNIIVNATSNPSRDRYSEIRENVVLWTFIDGILFILIVCGNCLTIAAVQFSRRLRSVVSNLFILSLAISDLLVGLTIPYHLAFYLDVTLGESHLMCILKFFFNIVACCVSIWNLIAIAVDRYIAIVYPLHYSRWITKRKAILIILMGWLAGGIMGVIPVFWNNWDTSTECEFDEILPPWYMAGIVTPVFSSIWLCMLTLYWRIWREAYKHAKQLRASITGLHDGGHSDWKSVQVVILILGCFTLCWLPYFIVACSQIFEFAENSSPIYYKAAFSLAMANSGMNPIIYAWKNRTFRRAFSHLLRCKAPDSHALIDDDNARQNMKRKSSSLPPSFSAPPPTPNSLISATPPPASAASTESYRRSSLNRYQHMVTAFPLPPPPPSPQSPMQQSVETMVTGPPTTYALTTQVLNNVHDVPSTLTKCCLKVVDLNLSAANSNIDLSCAEDLDCVGVQNDNEDHFHQYLYANHQRSAFRVVNYNNNNISINSNDINIKNDNNNNQNQNQNNNSTKLIIEDDLTKNYKEFHEKFSNDFLFLNKLTNHSPSESIVSAPLTPTGNLIVNILENLENSHHTTETLNRKNFRNSSLNSLIRNGGIQPKSMQTIVTTTTSATTISLSPSSAFVSTNTALVPMDVTAATTTSLTTVAQPATVTTIITPPAPPSPNNNQNNINLNNNSNNNKAPTVAVISRSRTSTPTNVECILAVNGNNNFNYFNSNNDSNNYNNYNHNELNDTYFCNGSNFNHNQNLKQYCKSSSAPQSINCWTE